MEDQLKVTQLKELLKELGLPIYGTKSVLLERLKNAKADKDKHPTTSNIILFAEHDDGDQDKEGIENQKNHARTRGKNHLYTNEREFDSFAIAKKFVQSENIWATSNKKKSC
jgi:hypothetical protein